MVLPPSAARLGSGSGSFGMRRRTSSRAACWRSSGSFGIQSGSCGHPGAAGSQGATGRRAVRESAVQPALGFVRCEDRAARACWRSSGSFGRGPLSGLAWTRGLLTETAARRRYATWRNSLAEGVDCGRGSSCASLTNSRNSVHMALCGASARDVRTTDPRARRSREALKAR
jgi:hypothetical protein